MLLITSFEGFRATLADMNRRQQAIFGLLAGLLHLIANLIFTFVYVSTAGFEYSLSSFSNGGIPLAVLTILGAAGFLLYANFEVLTPIALILSFDIIAIISSPPEVWTNPGPAGPPSIFSFYIHLFVIPLGFAVLVGAIEYVIRKRGKTTTT